MIDPYQAKATAVTQVLPEARLVVAHFHVIRLANAALDEVRSRGQHTTTGHRGRKDDLPYGSAGEESPATGQSQAGPEK